MDKLADLYKVDRERTRILVLGTFERDSVPQDMIDRYFKCYDEETVEGLAIAKWLDDNRDKSAD